MTAIRDVILNPSKLGASNMRREAIELPELYAHTLYVRPMTVKERESWQHENARQREAGLPPTQVRARAIVTCLVDENGAPVFQASDVPLIDELETGPVERLYDRILGLAGLVAEDPAKNLPTSSGDSSASPAS